MGNLPKSLTKGKTRNTDLLEFINIEKKREILCSLPFLIPLILKNSKNGLTKTRLVKIVSIVIISHGTEPHKEEIILYCFGPYHMKFKSTIDFLIDKGVIKESNDKLILTDYGLKWIHNQIKEFREDSILYEIIRDIDRFINMGINDLIREILYKSKYFKGEVRTISGKNFITVFDWSEYGKGIIEPYHYTLLYSYSRVENYFKNLKIDNELMLTDYAKIKKDIRSDQLIKQRKKLLRLKPLSKIFEKGHPPYLTQDKFEGKNYIYNLWYIVEGINIIHALAGINPSIEEIAMVCLVDYQYVMEDKTKTEEEKKKIRESMIRNEINKLWEEGILKRLSYKKKHRYMLTALKFYDVLTGKEYSVLDPKIIRMLYWRKIKPYRS